jgi:signal recognition particle GTPase
MSASYTPPSARGLKVVITTKTPAQQTTKPAQQTTKPVQQTTKPVHQTTKPAPSANNFPSLQKKKQSSTPPTPPEKPIESSFWSTMIKKTLDEERRQRSEQQQQHEKELQQQKRQENKNLCEQMLRKAVPIVVKRSVFDEIDFEEREQNRLLYQQDVAEVFDDAYENGEEDTSTEDLNPIEDPYEDQ